MTTMPRPRSIDDVTRPVYLPQERGHGYPTFVRHVPPNYQPARPDQDVRVPDEDTEPDES